MVQARYLGQHASAILLAAICSYDAAHADFNGGSVARSAQGAKAFENMKQQRRTPESDPEAYGLHVSENPPRWCANDEAPPEAATDGLFEWASRRFVS